MQSILNRTSQSASAAASLKRLAALLIYTYTKANEMDCRQKIQIEALLAAKTRSSLNDVLSRTVAELGFDYFSLYFQLPLPITRPAAIHLHNYPEGWMDHYWQCNYGDVDPTIVHTRGSVIPVVWRDTLSRQSELFWQDAYDHGLRAGLAQVSYGPGGNYGVLNLASADRYLNDNELHLQAFRFSWLAQASIQSMTNILRLDMLSNPSNRLTVREIEVLRWTADGKTAGEVGSIMEISERTVNFHVGNSLVKLDANNKTSAVIKAAMLGLL
ncbi:MAG: bacterial regulatory s, luxR family protein [Herbaspirillum sp.]|nr:bacterial regulatory s, luxR family protein [Herbaspirillum sp.]